MPEPHELSDLRPDDLVAWGPEVAMDSPATDEARALPSVRPPRGAPARPTVRRTYQLTATIPETVAAGEATFDRAIRCVLGWARKKIPGEFPEHAWGGREFVCQWPGQKLECLAVPEQGIWTLRLEQPDMPYRGRPAVGGRTWTTDIGLVRGEASILVGIRVFCASIPQVDNPVALTRPLVVVNLAENVHLSDVRQVSTKPWNIESDIDLDSLHSFLVNPERTLPVVVLTQPDKSRFSVPMADYVLDSDDLAWQLAGLAHVVKLPWDIAYKWTGRVGKAWSVFLGAVRTYMPGLDFDDDPPTNHPRTLADQILFWKSRESGRIGEAVFADFLVGKLALYAAAKRVNWAPPLAFVPEVRAVSTALNRQRATVDDDWKRLYEEEIGALQLRIKELEEEAEEYNDDAIQAGGERDSYKQENVRLRYQNDSLRDRLAEKLDGSPDQAIPIPECYDDLADWTSLYLVGRLVLHPRALRGLKDARYQDPAVVYRSLLLLAGEYRDMKMGRERAKDAFEARVQQLGLRIGGSISEERAGEEGDTYFVKYPTNDARPRFLEFHLRKGTTKDDLHCLAIYFFWDDDTNQVVVGWLPSHLENRMT